VVDGFAGQHRDVEAVDCLFGGFLDDQAVPGDPARRPAGDAKESSGIEIGRPIAHGVNS
jgi:hypothetical protein